MKKQYQGAAETPWSTVCTTYEQNMGVNAHVQIVDANGQHVATCGWPGAPKPADSRNAEAIVAAINAKATGRAA